MRIQDNPTAAWSMRWGTQPNGSTGQKGRRLSCAFSESVWYGQGLPIHRKSELVPFFPFPQRTFLTGPRIRRENLANAPSHSVPWRSPSHDLRSSSVHLAVNDSAHPTWPPVLLLQIAQDQRRDRQHSRIGRLISELLPPKSPQNGTAIHIHSTKYRLVSAIPV
ncbi:hypothetical protein LZ30DRAFT_726986 [Colletotrichum cereale]|nr:hypothetical protein LZ30DRAFT_726986 [Colletotrichum cereale]